LRTCKIGGRGRAAALEILNNIKLMLSWGKTGEISELNQKNNGLYK